jgi:hypothetical protein
MSRTICTLHFLVLIWGFTAILGLLISLFPPVEVVFYRTLIASGGLALILFFQKLSFAQDKGGQSKFLSTGVLDCRALDSFLWIGESINCISLPSRYGNYLILDQFPRTFGLEENGSSCMKCFWELSSSPAYISSFILSSIMRLGLANGFSISALLAAMFTVINAQFAKNYHHYQVTFYEMIGACISIALFFPIYKINALPNHGMLHFKLDNNGCGCIYALLGDSVHGICIFGIYRL